MSLTYLSDEEKVEFLKKWCTSNYDYAAMHYTKASIIEGDPSECYQIGVNKGIGLAIRQIAEILDLKFLEEEEEDIGSIDDDYF